MDMELDILAQTAMDFDLGSPNRRWVPLTQLLALTTVALCALIERLCGALPIALAGA